MASDVKKTTLDQVRNFGIMAHIDAGKTTLTERMLFLTGKIHQIGETHEGKSQMDYMEQEQERGITITSAATSIYWKDCIYNLIDTPGHVDFSIEVERSLRILDSAIAVLDAQTGVEPQTEAVWRQANKYNIPRAVFVNKMDKIGANFLYATDSVHKLLGGDVHPVQLNIGSESNFTGIIDLVQEKAYHFDGHDSEEMQVIPIPKDQKAEVAKWRNQLIEAVSHYDEEFLMIYLEGKAISVPRFKQAIRTATLTGKFFPTFLGSAFKNKGTKLILDGIADYLPSPLDVPPIEGHAVKSDVEEKRQADPHQPFSALAFKILNDPFVGNLVFFRVYSGTLKKGSYVYNSVSGKKERIGRILQMHANHRKDIDSVSAGSIAAVVGLKNTKTGETLCDINHPIILESIHFPEPVISLALEPKTKSDQGKMSIGLSKLLAEDPSFRVTSNAETGQTIISGMGELHLEVIVDRLKREFAISTTVGKPKVSYRETFTRACDAEGKYIKQSGGRGQYGHVKIKFEPNKDKGFEFVDKIVSGRIPREYIKPVQQGLVAAMQNGVLAGYDLIDVKATLYDGSYHDVDSSEMAFKLAASLCLKAAAKDAAPKILEPIMQVDVNVPEDYYGDVVGDLSSRRGKIEGVEQRGNAQQVKSKVPLSEMFGYATTLRGFTQGRGVYMMSFSHYAIAPDNIAQTIIEERQK